MRHARVFRLIYSLLIVQAGLAATQAHAQRAQQMQDTMRIGRSFQAALEKKAAASIADYYGLSDKFPGCMKYEIVRSYFDSKDGGKTPAGRSRMQSVDVTCSMTPDPSHVRITKVPLKLIPEGRAISHNGVSLTDHRLAELLNETIVSKEEILSADAHASNAGGANQP
jgi:hypothetical protein